MANSILNCDAKHVFGYPGMDMVAIKERHSVIGVNAGALFATSATDKTGYASQSTTAKPASNWEYIRECRCHPNRNQRKNGHNASTTHSTKQCILVTNNKCNMSTLTRNRKAHLQQATIHHRSIINSTNHLTMSDHRNSIHKQGWLQCDKKSYYNTTLTQRNLAI